MRINVACDFGWLDRLRILWHGKAETFVVLTEDPPKTCMVERSGVYVPRVLPSKPRYYEALPPTPAQEVEWALKQSSDPVPPS